MPEPHRDILIDDLSAFYPVSLIGYLSLSSGLCLAPNHLLGVFLADLSIGIYRWSIAK